MMPILATSTSRSLRQRADRLELQIAGRRRRLRFRVDGIKHAVIANLASPAMLLVAFGAGVALEKTGHRRSDSLAYLLNASVAAARMLASLSFAIQAATRGPDNDSPDHVQHV